MNKPQNANKDPKKNNLNAIDNQNNLRASSMPKSEQDSSYQNYLQQKRELNNKKNLLRGMSPNLNENKKYVLIFLKYF